MTWLRTRHVLAAVAVAVGASACAILVGSLDGTRSFDGGTNGDASARPDVRLDVHAARVDAADASADAALGHADARDVSVVSVDAGHDSASPPAADAGSDACAPGTCVPALVAGGQPVPLEILAVYPADESLYWVGTSGQIFVKLSAQPPVALPTISGAAGLAVDDSFVYFFIAHQPGVRRVNRLGTGTAILWATSITPAALTIDQSYVYIAEGSGPTTDHLYRLPQPGPDAGSDDAGGPDGAVNIPYTPLTELISLAMDSSHLYAVGYNEILFEMPTGTLVQTPIHAPLPLDIFFPLAGDPTGVVWHTVDGGALQRFNPTTLIETNIATSHTIVRAASDGVHVYWIDDPLLSTADASASAFRPRRATGGWRRSRRSPLARIGSSARRRA